MASNNNAGSFIITDDKDQFLLPLGRLIFENLFTPVEFTNNDGTKSKPKYSLSLMFEPNADFSAYQAALQRLLKSPEVQKIAPSRGSKEEKDLLARGLTPDDITYSDEYVKTLKKAIKKETNPEKLEKYPHLIGKMVANMGSYFPPVIMDAKKNHITALNKDTIYRGCYGQALVSVALHSSTGQLFFRLKGFQKVKDGEPIGFSNAKTDLFESFTQTDSLAEEDDGI